MTRSDDAPLGAGSPLKWLAAVISVGLGTYIVFALRSLIAPVLVSGLLAYVCHPLVTRLERFRLPRDAAIGLLLVAVTLVSVFVVVGARRLVPSDADLLELRVSALYKLSTQYGALIGLGSPRGNRLYRLIHAELKPLLDQLVSSLALTPEEHAEFLAQLSSRGHDREEASQRLLAYDRANTEALRKRAPTATAESSEDASAPPTETASPTPRAPTKPAAVRKDLSTWLIAPLVFFLLLRDAGGIMAGLLAMLPNPLFEPALTVIADLDHALGSYVRGVFLGCGFLGLTVGLLLAIVGVPPRWAIPIGIVSGASNVIPYVGSAVALLSGLAYALVAGDIHPLLPWVNSQNFALWVVGAVALAELLKNLLYEPVVLGGQVKLHPIVIGVGAFGGAIMFGPVGMFLAIPTITIVKVFVSSSARQLKAYGLV